MTATRSGESEITLDKIREYQDKRKKDKKK